MDLGALFTAGLELAVVLEVFTGLASEGGIKPWEAELSGEGLVT